MIALGLAAALAWATRGPQVTADPSPLVQSWLVTGADVLMPRGGVLTAVKGMAVLGTGPEILGIAPLGELDNVPADVHHIDGEGATLLPGLMDAWCQLRDATDLDCALAAGVTTLRVMDRPSWLQRVLRDRKAAGIPSPHCIAFGRDLRRHVARNPFQEGLSGDDLRKVIEEDVATQAQERVGGFTLGHDTEPEVLRMVLGATSRYRIPLSIRTPGTTPFGQVAFQGDAIGSIETFLGHWLGMEGRGRSRQPKRLPSVETIGAHVALAIEARRAVLTGLVEHETASRVLETEQECLVTDFVRNLYDRIGHGKLLAPADVLSDLSPLTRVCWSQAAHQLRRNLPMPMLENLKAATPLLHQAVRLLDESGATLVVATGAGAPYVRVGCSVIDEIELLHGAGLSRQRALVAATSAAAAFMGRARVGTIGVGRVADLVLVEGQPLGDLNALRSVRAVACAGVWLDRDGMAARHAANCSQLELEIEFVVAATIDSIGGSPEAAAERLKLYVAQRGITMRRETVESIRDIYRTADVPRPEHAVVLDKFLQEYFGPPDV